MEIARSRVYAIIHGINRRSIKDNLNILTGRENEYEVDTLML